MIRPSKKLSTKFVFLVNYFQSIYNSFLSNTKLKSCLLCNEITRNSLTICPPCLSDLPWNKHACRLCALPITLDKKPFTQFENTSAFVCGECIKSLPPFTRSICAFHYNFPVDKLIQQVKYHNKQYWLSSLCHLLSEEIAMTYLNDEYPNTLIPVPMHPKKKRIRTYNQAEIISLKLSQKLRIPTHSKLLKKIKLTDAQAGLDKAHRIRNLKGSIIVAPERITRDIKGKHLALIDDVMTTRATAELASKLLLKAGARRVDIWCIARTPKKRDLSTGSNQF